MFVSPLRRKTPCGRHRLIPKGPRAQEAEGRKTRPVGRGSPHGAGRGIGETPGGGKRTRGAWLRRNSCLEGTRNQVKISEV